MIKDPKMGDIVFFFDEETEQICEGTVFKSRRLMDRTFVGIDVLDKIVVLPCEDLYAEDSDIFDIWCKRIEAKKEEIKKVVKTEKDFIRYLLGLKNPELDYVNEKIITEIAEEQFGIKL